MPHPFPKKILFPYVCKDFELHYNFLKNVEFFYLKSCIFLQIVKPVCSGKLVWCSLTQLCEKKCQSNLEAMGKLDAEHSCGVKNDEEFCSNEETCGEKTEMLKCPHSIMKDASDTQPPIGYELVKKDLYNSFLPKDKEKVNIPIAKAINDEDIYDMNLAHAGYRTNLEDSYMGDVFLAFRCPSETPGLCAQLPYE